MQRIEHEGRRGGQVVIVGVQRPGRAQAFGDVLRQHQTGGATFEADAVGNDVDVQELAVKNTQVNFQKNKKHLPSDLTVILSDMFDNVPPGYFDFIVINPPYYFADVNYETQKAWFCGKNGEYFHKLFSQLHERIREETNIFMVLAENCDIQRIKEIAEAKGFVLTLSLEKKLWWETNYIFKISSQKQDRKSTFV